MRCSRDGLHERKREQSAPAGVGFSELGAESGTVPAESKRAFLPIEAPEQKGHPAFLSAPWGRNQ